VKIGVIAHIFNGFAAGGQGPRPINDRNAVDLDTRKHLKHAPRDTQEHRRLREEQTPGRRVGTRDPHGQGDDDRDNREQDLTARRGPVRAVERRLASERQSLTRARATLTALSPQATLDRGYALLKTPSGQLITSSAQVKKGDLIEGILASGRMVAQVVGATAPTVPTES